MNIDHLKHNPDATFIDILLVDVHGEYQLPKVDGVTQYEVYNGYRFLENLDVAGMTEDEANKLGEKIIKSYENSPKFNSAIDIDDAYNYYLIGLQIQKKEAPKLLDHYVDVLEFEIYMAANNVGGDDDYFDYFPGYVEMYEQLTEILGLQDRFKSFIKDRLLPIFEDPNDPDAELPFYYDWI